MSQQTSYSSSNSHTSPSSSANRRLCECNLPVVLKTSWSDTNPGRRFLRCPKKPFQVRDKQCKVFEWIDPEADQRYVDVINQLRAEIGNLKETGLQLKEENLKMKDDYMQVQELFEVEKMEQKFLMDKLERMEMEKTFLMGKIGEMKRLYWVCGALCICLFCVFVLDLY